MEYILTLTVQDKICQKCFHLVNINFYFFHECYNIDENLDQADLINFHSFLYADNYEIKYILGVFIILGLCLF